MQRTDPTLFVDPAPPRAKKGSSYAAAWVIFVVVVIVVLFIVLGCWNKKDAVSTQVAKDEAEPGPGAPAVAPPLRIIHLNQKNAATPLPF